MILLELSQANHSNTPTRQLLMHNSSVQLNIFITIYVLLTCYRIQRLLALVSRDNLFTRLSYLYKQRNNSANSSVLMLFDIIRPENQMSPRPHDNCLILIVCNGLVSKSANIISLGQYSMLKSFDLNSSRT